MDASGEHLSVEGNWFLAQVLGVSNVKMNNLVEGELGALLHFSLNFHGPDGYGPSDGVLKVSDFL